jgi:hypothetical protein
MEYQFNARNKIQTGLLAEAKSARLKPASTSAESARRRVNLIEPPGRDRFERRSSPGQGPRAQKKRGGDEWSVPPDFIC